ncbi:hypothetical protein [Mycobacterium sp. ACS4054]|uniref:hypothetical protein n=1 Tax=Mycobacterium sp. ACS4054 TaxID=1834119 RepID=UPI0018D44FD1|nr:hypothetical protein [Mycobacterium sp. ACS4054]
MNCAPPFRSIGSITDTEAVNVADSQVQPINECAPAVDQFADQAFRTVSDTPGIEYGGLIRYWPMVKIATAATPITATSATKITAIAARTISSSVNRQRGCNSARTASPRQAKALTLATAEATSSSSQDAYLSTGSRAAIAVVISAPRLAVADWRYLNGTFGLLVNSMMECPNHDCGNDP